MIIVKTPLRLSFVGGGSDLASFYQSQPGQVICTTIDKYVYAIVKERFDNKIYLNYSKKESVDRVDDIQHNLIREALKITGVDRGVEITTLADIPSSGSGLGSSSAITVALLHALHTYQNNLVTAEQLAKEACQIEIDILQKPIGRQDQYAVAYGGINRFVFFADHSVKRHPISMTAAECRKFAASILLFFTGLTRNADAILTEQNQNIKEGIKFSNLSQMVELVEPFIQAMQLNDIKTCAMLLEKNWQLKRQLASGISIPEIDDMYEIAKKAGALSGKIAGAGGGGFMMFLVDRENKSQIFDAMSAYREFPFTFEMSGSKVILDARSYSSK